MLYASDPSVKGDVQIVTKGAEGLLQKETEKQSALELLQVIGAVGGTLGQAVNMAPVVGWAMNRLFGAMGIPDDVLAAMNVPPPQMQAPQQAPAGMGNGMNPASNPAPEPQTPEGGMQ